MYTNEGIMQQCESAKDKLTVHIEANTSAQVGLYVFEIGGLASVHAIVCSLDRLQHQDTTLTY